MVLAEGRKTHQSSALNTLSHKGLVGQVETLHGPYEAGAQGRVLNWNTALGGQIVVAIRARALDGSPRELQSDDRRSNTELKQTATLSSKWGRQLSHRDQKGGSQKIKKKDVLLPRREGLGRDVHTSETMATP